MGKNAVKSVRGMLELLSSRPAVEGHPVPANDGNSATFESSFASDDCHMVPRRRKPGRRALLDGNFARRKLPLRETEYCIWDTELAGFGLRVRPSGNYFWFVRVRHRGKHRRISLGRTDELDASVARAQARRILAEVALGIPGTGYFIDDVNRNTSSRCKPNRCTIRPHSSLGYKPPAPTTTLPRTAGLPYSKLQPAQMGHHNRRNSDSTGRPQ